MAQNIVIPQTLEQRISWKTTLDAIVVTAGMTNAFTLHFTDVLTDATPGIINASFYKFFMRPFVREDLSVLESKEPVVIEPESKELSITLGIPKQVKRGYYLFQIVFYNEEQNPINSYSTYICVDKAIEPLKDNPHMTLESVRAEFGDISFEDNRILDSQEVGTWDICNAVQRAIQQWNNTAPRLTQYSGETFPYPEILRAGVIYMMIQSLWTLLERNRMTYAAGNTTVDLEKRADAYRALLQEYKTRWSGGMSQAKNEENIMAFDQNLGYL